MIEIVYKSDEEDTNQEINIKLPKNVRQIGECEHNYRKIYVEDFVMTYVKHFSSRKLKYGVLLGNITRGNGNTYVFITGAVCANAMVDNDIIFDEDVWTGIYEEVKTFFDDVEIVGWFASMPSLLPNDLPNIQKKHLDNFAGNDKVCFLLDRSECEENFYVYDDGGMRTYEGHYIYYEKNADMQSYMSLHMDTQEIPENYQQIKKQSINAKVHQIFLNNKKIIKDAMGYDDESKNDINEENLDVLFGTVQKNIVNESNNKQESQDEKIVDIEKVKNRRLPSFAYSASSFMLIAILIGTVALMNASGQLKELKSAVIGMVTKETTGDNNNGDSSNDLNKDTAKVVDVAGEVETTSANTNPNINSETSIVDANAKNTPETTLNQANAKNTPETTLNQANGNTVSETTLASNETTAPILPEETTNPIATVSPVDSNIGYYVVQSGDSLYSISIRTYGSANMVEKIKQANNITNENFIKEGQKIVLPQ